MGQDFKISQLLDKGFTNLTQITGDATTSGSDPIKIPCVFNNQNFVIDIVQLTKLIKSYIDTIGTDFVTSITNNPTALQAIATALGGAGGGGGGSVDLTTVNNRLTALESRASTIETDMSTPSKWPKHVIKVTDGTNTNEYNLATHMGGTAAIIQIESTAVTKPLFYVELSLNQPQISNGYITGGIRARVKGTDAGGTALTGGQVSKVEFAVEYGGNTLWNGNYVTCTTVNNSTFSSPVNVTTSNEFLFTYEINEAVQSTASNVTVRMKINERTDVIVQVSAGLGGTNTASALINPVSS